MTKPKTNPSTKPPRWTGTKAAFVRSCGTAEAPLVLIAAKRAGLLLTLKYVHNVRSADRMEHAPGTRNRLNHVTATRARIAAARVRLSTTLAKTDDLHQELQRVALTHGLPAIEASTQRLRAELA